MHEIFLGMAKGGACSFLVPDNFLLFSHEFLSFCNQYLRSGFREQYPGVYTCDIEDNIEMMLRPGNAKLILDKSQ